jgi:sugar phosphate isomerase/epimerase
MFIKTRKLSTLSSKQNSFHMSNRRLFLRQTGAFALGTLLLPSCANNSNTSSSTKDSSTANSSMAAGSAAPGNIGPIGVQLWSVKDVLEKDLAGTIQKLSAIGYKEIESYPGEMGHYYGMEPKEFKKLLEDNGMKLISSHVGSGSKTGKAETWHQATLLQKFDELVEHAAETGQEYLTCSWLDESLRGDLKGVADLFNAAGEKCKKRGLQFAYHNHDFEFKKAGDGLLYDYMLDHTDKDLVKYEMDMYWVVRGGQDPVAYFNKYPNRFPLGHVKDMDKQDQSKNTEIGKGSINFAELLKTAKQNGMKHFIIEQESFTMPSIQSMKEDYEYMSHLTI